MSYDILDRCERLIDGDVVEWQSIVEATKDACTEIRSLRDDVEELRTEKRNTKQRCIELVQALEAAERESFNMRLDLGWTNKDSYTPSKLLSEMKAELRV